MAWSSNISFALVLSSLLVMMISAQSQPTVGTPICSRIHGVRVGETCFSIIQKFALEQPLFLRLNPNINCSRVIQ
ncbi:hypothetical protein P8452_33070 [Trifolium repens]|nr:hypothetical protein P8452_33070 [Trifolium repens]